MNSGRFGGPQPSMFNRAGGLYGGAGGISLAKCSPDPAPPGKFPQNF